MGKTRFTKVKLHNKGFRELRTSQWAVGLVMHEAKALANRAGPGYSFSLSGTPKNRAHASVYPDTAEAMRDNAKNNTLLHTLGGG